MDYWRIGLLGDCDVGKTTLAKQFTLSCFLDIVTPEEEEEAFRKQLVVDNRMCFLELLDPHWKSEPLQSDHHVLKEGDGFLLIYSIASRASFDGIDVYHQALLESAALKGPNKPVFILVGNKVDKQSYEGEVTRGEGVAKAKELGCEFLQTSSKTAQNVERAFIEVTRQLRRQPKTAKKEDHVPTKTRRGMLGRGRSCIVM